MAYHHALRPEPAKLATNMALRAKVEKDLEKKYLPEQITGRLCLEFPDNPEMRVSPPDHLPVFTCSRAARYAAIWRSVCAPAGRCGARVARSGNVRTR
jgi:hypothetical protein